MQIEIANHANLNFYKLVFYIELHSLQPCSHPPFLCYPPIPFLPTHPFIKYDLPQVFWARLKAYFR